ncbi:MAG: preprotein translocase subunit SecY, partial [bacterium]
MFKSIENIFSIPDLRKRVLYTLFLLAVFRVGAHIPVPGIDASAFTSKGGLFDFIDMFSGGAFKQLTIFALGIMPYISASIILQLLTVVVPYLERLQKEGEAGRKKIVQYTRYGTVVLTAFQAWGLSIMIRSMPGVVINPGIAFQLLMVLTITAGTAFLMWLGEQITEKGIGNGISLIIFAGI